MSGIINFNAQIAPMEHVEKVVRQEQEHSQVKQEALMQSAAERLSKDNEQVQKTAESRKDRKVGRKHQDDENSRRKWHSSTKEGTDAGLEGQADDQTLEAGAQQGGLWSGNIVNTKV